MRKFVFIAIFFFFLPSILVAGKRKVIESLPFEKVGSNMVVTLRINASSMLSFILDSGVSNTIITQLMPEDSVALNYSDMTDLYGLGTGNRLNVFESNNNIIKIGKLNLKNKKVFVLEEDIFHLTQQTGTKINGLIGFDFFQDYIVEIDYTNSRIRFYDRDLFQIPKGYETIPMTIEDQKMFIQISVLETDTTQRTAKMLIDTGAELNAWFQTFKKGAVQQPSKTIRGTIGQGLNGEITGKYGRFPQICFGKFCLKKAIVSFPDSAAISEIVSTSDRDGTIGSQILSRFNFFIDYNQKRFYFKPNGNFRDDFKYNVTGIEIAQILPFVPQTEVCLVWENSPAALSGVQVGDQIVEINGQKAFRMKINEIKMLFETPSKYPLSLVLLRNGEEIKVKIDMNSRI